MKFVWLASFLILASFPSLRVQAQTSSVQVEGIISRVTDKLWNQNEIYWHHGDYPRIIALDRIITQTDPTFVECYATGGWLMESLGNLDDAEAYYMQGVARNPRVSYAYWNLGFFYFSTRHDYPEASRILKMDTAERGADINDWKMLAHSYEKMGDWNDAVATWKQIAVRWPKGLSVDRLLHRALDHQRSAGTTPL